MLSVHTLQNAFPGPWCGLAGTCSAYPTPLRPMHGETTTKGPMTAQHVRAKPLGSGTQPSKGATLRPQLESLKQPATMRPLALTLR